MTDTTTTTAKGQQSGPGNLRKALEKANRENRQLKAELDQLGAECSSLELEVELAEKHVPTELRALAHQHKIEPTAEAVETFVQKLKDEARTAQELFATYDAEQQAEAVAGDIDMTDLPFTADEVKEAVSAALGRFLEPDDSDEYDEGDA